MVFSIADWFEAQQGFKSHVPIVLSPQPLGVSDIGTIFGMCSYEGCLIPDCTVEYAHVHVALNTPIEVFAKDFSRLMPSSQEALIEMNLALTTFEELYHFWQCSNNPNAMGKILTSRQEYYSDALEQEAKSFAYSSTEQYLKGTWRGNSLGFLRSILFEMRRTEQ